MQVDGTDGSVVWRDGELIWIDGEGKRTKEPVGGGDMPRFMAASWTELLDAIEEGRAPHHGGRDNLWTVALLTGAYKSAAENSVVKIDIAEK